MTAIRVSGAALLLFQAFFIFAPMAILGAAIDWPASLDFAPDVALPLIHANAEAVRLGYGLYLGWSLAFAASAALIVALARGPRPLDALSGLAIALGTVSALARAIGIVRWLTGSLALASAHAQAPDGSAERLAIETTQLALNAYGGSIGEDLGVSLFASFWLMCVGAVILKDKGLPAWLGWTAFPAAAISSMPAWAMLGVEPPLDIIVSTASMLLWIAVVAIVLLFQTVRAKRPAVQDALLEGTP